MSCWTCKHIIVYYFDGRVYCEIYKETKERMNCPHYKPYNSKEG